MSYSVNIPDFAGSLARGEQMQASRLQMMAQQQALDDAQKYSAVARDVLPQLGTAEGPARLSLLSRLAGSGMQGAHLALPMMNQERQRAEGARLISGLFPGMGGEAAPPAATPASMPVAPPVAAAPAPGAERPPLDVRAVNQRFAAERQRIMDDPNLTQEQQAAALARVSAAHAAALGGAREIPGGYRSPPGVDGAYAGLSPPSGVVPPVAPRGAPAAGTAAPVGTVPAQPAAGARLPTPQQLIALMASGNPSAMEFARSVAPLVARENPNFVVAEVGGRRLMVNPQNPAERIDLGPSGDPAAAARDDRRHAFADTSAIRREFSDTQAAKDYAMVRPSFEAITRAQRTDTRAADIDMVFAFAKMLDPTSVVREGEQITLMRTGGVFDTVAGYVSGLAGGGRLTPEVRANIVAQAQQRYQVSADAHDERLDYYRGIAQESGFNPNQIGRPARDRNPAVRNTEATSPRAPGAPETPPTNRPAPPRVGEVRDGYRFTGGDPADRNAWEAVR